MAEIGGLVADLSQSILAGETLTSLDGHFSLHAPVWYL